MIINNKNNEVFCEQHNQPSNESKSIIEMSEIALTNAMLCEVNCAAVSVYSKTANINLIHKGMTLLEQFLIFWLHGLYKQRMNLFDFIEYINSFINMGARFTDELNIQIQQDISKEVSNFIEPIDDSKCTAVAYKKENVAFISISNARLRMGKLLESDFCCDHRLPYSHFNINGNKGYAQKDYNTGIRNYVVYRGCINMRASWSVMSSNENSPQTTKKESISIYIKGNGTIHVSKQDELRYKNEEINFDGCSVHIGGVMLEDALEKGHWLYSNNQIFCDSGYCSRGTSPERKTPIFDSNGNNLVNPDACKINQESNKDLPIKDNPVSDAEKDQLIDSEDSLSNDYESTEIGSSTFELPQSIEAISINKNDIKKAEEENRKIEEENKACFRKLNSNKFYAKLSKGKRCNYDQQMTIAYIDNNQENSEYNNQNNNVTESNTDNSIDQYCEDMDNKALTFANSTISVQDKVAAWLNHRQNERDFEKNCYNNNFHLREDSLNATISNAIPSLGETDRSSANGLSWDNNTLGSNDIEFDYNPPRKALSSNNKYRNNSVSSRLGILHEIPSYNLNELSPLIRVIDAQDRVVYTEFKNN